MLWYDERENKGVREKKLHFNRKTPKKKLAEVEFNGHEEAMLFNFRGKLASYV